MAALIYDGDEILFQSCKACEHEILYPDGWVSWMSNIDEVMESARLKISHAQEVTGCQDVILAFSDHERNFRKELDPTYKGNRKNTRKPLNYFTAEDRLKDEFTTICLPGLEADDVMGLCSLEVDYIVSVDKDMDTIPDVRRYSPLHDEHYEPIHPHQADLNFLFQALTGDTVDGYSGCPGIGKVTARKILDSSPKGDEWESVVAAFEKKGKTREDALLQARLARILRPGEYDFDAGEPILWDPINS